MEKRKNKETAVDTAKETVQANFPEDDQLFTMEVQAADESFGEVNSMSDQNVNSDEDISDNEKEISFRDSSQIEDSPSDGEVDSNSERYKTEQSDSDADYKGRHRS